MEFFGVKTLIPKGPAVFSLKTGAAVVPATLIRQEDDRFKLIFDKPIYPEPTGDKANDIKRHMKIYIDVIERYIRRYPDQWYVFRKVWNNA